MKSWFNDILNYPLTRRVVEDLFGIFFRLDRGKHVEGLAGWSYALRVFSVCVPTQ